MTYFLPSDEHQMRATRLREVSGVVLVMTAELFISFQGVGGEHLGAL